MKRIFICAPASSAQLHNPAPASAYCRAVRAAGDLPCAPHLFHGTYLCRGDAEERQVLMALAAAELGRCDAVNVYGPPTTYMAEMITLAVDLRIPIRWFDAEGRAV